MNVKLLNSSSYSIIKILDLELNIGISSNKKENFQEIYIN